MKDNSLLMVSIHAKQLEAWIEVLKTLGNKPKQEFKMRLNTLENSLIMFNKYMTTKDDKEVFELSAQVSDSIMMLSSLPQKEIDLITDLIEQKHDEYTKNNK